MKVTIENFQSWTKVVVTMASHGELTVITGDSGKGKTAILRAIKWLYYNTPSGIDFIRVGATFARVTIEEEGRPTVVRERSKSYNRYIITPPDGERQVYEGFGSNVPLEVQEATGVRVLTIGEGDQKIALPLNLAEQLNGPFLGNGAVSAPGRAKILGKLAGTEEIDWAGKNVGKDLHRRNRDEERLTGELAGLDTKIQGYAYLPAMAEQIGKLEVIVAKVKELQERQRQLQGIKDRLILIQGAITREQEIVDRWRHLGTLEGIVAKTEATLARQQVVQGYAKTIAGCEGEIRTASAVLRRLHGLDESLGIVRHIDHGLIRQQLLRDSKAKIQAATASIEAAKQILVQTAKLPEAEALLHKITVARERGATLTQIDRVYREASLAMYQHEDVIAQYAGLEQAEQKLTVVVQLVERQGTLAGIAGQIKQLDTQITSARKVAIVYENQVAELTGAYKDALVEAKICPTCGGTINPEFLKEVI